MNDSSIIHLNPSGPTGLGLNKLQLDQADFQSDLPEQYWPHLF